MDKYAIGAASRRLKKLQQIVNTLRSGHISIVCNENDEDLRWAVTNRVTNKLVLVVKAEEIPAAIFSLREDE